MGHETKEKVRKNTQFPINADKNSLNDLSTV